MGIVIPTIVITLLVVAAAWGAWTSRDQPGFALLMGVCAIVAIGLGWLVIQDERDRMECEILHPTCIDSTDGWVPLETSGG